MVDDFAPFRRYIASTLQSKPEVQVICEACDGLEAVQKAEELRPDLILLDIGLPTLNGMEAARRIRKLSPKSKILFLSQESSADLVREALSLGAWGYVVKSDAGSELLAAVSAVLRGDAFVGGRFAGHDFTRPSDVRVPENVRRGGVFTLPQPHKMDITRRHEAQFYWDDSCFLDGFTQFIGASLKVGNAVIVVASQSHRNSLLPRLQAHGLDIGAAIEQGRYVSLDATDTLSTFMVDDLPDPLRFSKVVGDLIVATTKAAKAEHPRVSACGECAALLWAQGKAEAAIRLEHLWDEVVKTHDLDILCGYPARTFHREEDSHIFRRICAAHSTVHSR